MTCSVCGEEKATVVLDGRLDKKEEKTNLIIPVGKLCAIELSENYAGCFRALPERKAS